jgi:hypothetical protein
MDLATGRFAFKIPEHSGCAVFFAKGEYELI